MNSNNPITIAGKATPMKTTLTMNNITARCRFAFLLATALPAVAMGQSFSYNRTIPSFTFSYQDSDNAGRSGSSIPLSIPASTITETLEIVGQTVREYGTWDIPAFTLGSASVTESRTQTPTFPNPPTFLTGILTANTTSSPGGSITFDTGFRPWTWTGTGAQYTVPGFTTSGSIPITASYTLVTGGDTHTETKTGSLGVRATAGVSTVNAINFPTSLPLSQSWTAVSTGGPRIFFTPYTAPNGFEANVTVVPEPTSVVASLLGLGVLALRRRRQVRL